MRIRGPYFKGGNGKEVRKAIKMVARESGIDTDGLEFVVFPKKKYANGNGVNGWAYVDERRIELKIPDGYDMIDLLAVVDHEIAHLKYPWARHPDLVPISWLMEKWKERISGGR